MFLSKTKGTFLILLFGVATTVSTSALSGNSKGKSKGVRNTEAVIDITVDNHCGVTIDSSKGISNIVIKDGTSTHKVEFGSEKRSYKLDGVWADYIDSLIFVKSGNNGSKGLGAVQSYDDIHIPSQCLDVEAPPVDWGACPCNTSTSWTQSPNPYNSTISFDAIPDGTSWQVVPNWPSPFPRTGVLWEVTDSSSVLGYFQVGTRSDVPTNPLYCRVFDSVGSFQSANSYSYTTQAEKLAVISDCANGMSQLIDQN